MDIDDIRNNKRIFFIYYVGTIIDFDIENDRSVWRQTQ